MDDYAADARAGVAWLAARPDVDRARIGLIGHSEGGVVGPLVAAETRDVAFLVLIAAPAMRGADISMLQGERIARAAGASDDQVALQQTLNRRIFDVIMAGHPDAETRVAIRGVLTEELAKIGVTSDAVIAAAEKQMEPQIRRGLTPWFRHFLSHDPIASLRRLRVPVLALYGSLDVQVPAAENAPRMQAAIAGSSDLSDVQILQGLNHLFQTAKTGAMDEYGKIEETFAPAALEAISRWLRRVIG
jgi:pimeloyl-ACP methyl ester carboxylesterase